MGGALWPAPLKQLSPSVELGESLEELVEAKEVLRIVKRHNEAAHGHYRTKRLILERYDAMAEAAASGTPYETVLGPPPADPRVAHPPRTS